MWFKVITLITIKLIVLPAPLAQPVKVEAEVEMIMVVKVMRDRLASFAATMLSSTAIFLNTLSVVTST